MRAIGISLSYDTPPRFPFTLPSQKLPELPQQQQQQQPDDDITALQRSTLARTSITASGPSFQGPRSLAITRVLQENALLRSDSSATRSKQQQRLDFTDIGGLTGKSSVRRMSGIQAPRRRSSAGIVAGLPQLLNEPLPETLPNETRRVVGFRDIPDSTPASPMSERTGSVINPLLMRGSTTPKRESQLRGQNTTSSPTPGSPMQVPAHLTLDPNHRLVRLHGSGNGPVAAAEPSTPMTVQRTQVFHSSGLSKQTGPPPSAMAPRRRASLQIPLMGTIKDADGAVNAKSSVRENDAGGSTSPVPSSSASIANIMTNRRTSATGFGAPGSPTRITNSRVTGTANLATPTSPEGIRYRRLSNQDASTTNGAGSGGGRRRSIEIGSGAQLDGLVAMATAKDGTPVWQGEDGARFLMLRGSRMVREADLRILYGVYIEVYSIADGEINLSAIRIYMSKLNPRNVSRVRLATALCHALERFDASKRLVFEDFIKSTYPAATDMERKFLCDSASELHGLEVKKKLDQVGTLTDLVAMYAPPPSTKTKEVHPDVLSASKIFQMLDEKGAGYVSVEALIGSMRGANLSITEAFLRKQMSKIVAEHVYRISKEDFIRFILYHVNHEPHIDLGEWTSVLHGYESVLSKYLMGRGDDD